MISLDRQTLADYLGVERSAMSAELSKLRKDGIIECEKNWFCDITFYYTNIKVFINFFLNYKLV